jgi:hypothetical protein
MTANRRTFEKALQILLVIVIQATHRDALAVALQFAWHTAIATTVVCLHRETTVGPELALGSKTLGCLRQCRQQAARIGPMEGS